MNTEDEIFQFLQFSELPDVVSDKIIEFILIQPKPMVNRLVSKQFYCRINNILKLSIVCSPKNGNSRQNIFKFKGAKAEFDINDFCDNTSRDFSLLVKNVALSARGKCYIIRILSILNGKTSEGCNLDITVLDTVQTEPESREIILSDNNNNTLRNQFGNFWLTSLSIAAEHNEFLVPVEFIRFLVYDQSKLINLDFGRTAYNLITEISYGHMFDTFSTKLNSLRVFFGPGTSIIDQDNTINLLVQKFPNLTNFNSAFVVPQYPKIRLLSKWKYLTKLTIDLEINNNIPIDYNRLHGNLINLREFNLTVYDISQPDPIESAEELIINLSQLHMPYLVICNIELKNIILDLNSLTHLLTGPCDQILQSITHFSFTIPNLSNNQTRSVYRNRLIELYQQCTKLRKFHCSRIGQLISITNFNFLRSLPVLTTKFECSEHKALSIFSTIFVVSPNDEQEITSIYREQMVRLLLAMSDTKNKKFQLLLDTRDHYFPAEETLLKIRNEFNQIFNVISYEELSISLCNDSIYKVKWLLTDGRERKLLIIF